MKQEEWGGTLNEGELEEEEAEGEIPPLFSGRITQAR